MKEPGLFARKEPAGPRPLADRMRPRTLDEFAGQAHLVGPGAPLRKVFESGKLLPSMILWGPPGSGKTTLAQLLARATNAEFVAFSAVLAGVADARREVEAARGRDRPTVLFVDEIHRFNRAQQDAFLPHVEGGTITLIGATTENPSFEVNAPLLSRCGVYRLELLSNDDLLAILKRATADAERGLPAKSPKPKAGALEAIADLANGDARVGLNLLELAAASGEVSPKRVREVAQRRSRPYDKDREEHYNTISAYIKSLRGSDPDAALYWLARMLEAGEDPLFVARRMVIFASEDVGNADPQALAVAVAVKDAVDFVGMPEAYLNLAQGTTYMATAPKSNASLLAYAKAKEDVERTRNDPVPLHLRNPVTPTMKAERYGEGYVYPHSHPEEAKRQAYRPPNVEGSRYYEPKDAGFEREIRRRMGERGLEPPREKE